MGLNYVPIHNMQPPNFDPIMAEKVHVIHLTLFSFFSNHLPVEEGLALQLNKLLSPSPKDALYQVWLK